MAFEHGGALRIEVEGVNETIDALRRIDRALVTELKKGFREDAQPILSSAKGYARALGGSGDYAASMAIRTIKDGVRIQASDPGSGTIEFAHRGAFYRSGVRAGKPAGVPSGNPPRALVKASLEHEDEVKRSVETRIERVITRYLHG